MYSAFVKLMNLSVAASILILAVMLLRLLLRRAPRWTVCLLWALVAVRMLCPLSIPSPLSVYEFLGHAAHEPGEVSWFHYNRKPEKPMIALDMSAFSIPDGVSAEASGALLSVGPFSFGTQGHAPDSYLPAVIALWGMGAAVMLARAAYGYGKLRRMVREAIPLQDHILLCDAVQSPFILGICKPRIYLPTGLDEGTYGPIIAHETAHLQRRDHWWKALGYVLLTLHWFNPMVWAAFMLFCRDVELACDERVIRDYDLEAKKIYSTALLLCSEPHRTVMSYPVAFCEVGVKARIRSVLTHRRAPRWMAAAAVVLCIALTAGFMTGPYGGNVRRVQRMVGESNLYTPQEIDEMMDVVVRYFDAEYEGCTLLELTYNEAFSQKYCAEWAAQYGADRAVVLTSTFYANASGGDGSFNPNSTYTGWQWILTQEGDARWQMRTCGYA